MTEFDFQLNTPFPEDMESVHEGQTLGVMFSRESWHQYRLEVAWGNGEIFLEVVEYRDGIRQSSSKPIYQVPNDAQEARELMIDYHYGD